MQKVVVVFTISKGGVPARQVRDTYHDTLFNAMTVQAPSTLRYLNQKVLTVDEEVIEVTFEVVING